MGDHKAICKTTPMSEAENLESPLEVSVRWTELQKEELTGFTFTYRQDPPSIKTVTPNVSIIRSAVLIKYNFQL